jgi:hypothetical protein
MEQHAVLVTSESETKKNAEKRRPGKKGKGRKQN